MIKLYFDPEYHFIPFGFKVDNLLTWQFNGGNWEFFGGNWENTTFNRHNKCIEILEIHP